MAAATLQLNNMGRGPNAWENLAGVSVTITATATVYAAASGGLPIDLVGVLQQAAPAGFDAPNYIQAINPADIIGVTFTQLSTNGYMPASLVVGTPVYSNVPWQSDNGPAATPGIMTSCPATIRLMGTGAGSGQGMGQVADGAVTDTITLILLINRNGANN